MHWCVSSDGLRIREAPDMNSKQVALIAFGESAVVVQDKKDDGKEPVLVAGVYGNWVQVRYGTLKGWAFSGFLRPYNINELITKAKEQYKDDFLFFKSMLGDFAVVSYRSSCVTADETFPVDSIWRYKDKKWQNVNRDYGADSGCHKSHLFYLNDDEYPDMIIYGGCCNSTVFYVLIGLSNDMTRTAYVQSFEPPDNEGYVHLVSMGRCGKTVFEEVSSKSDSEKKVTYRFDCKSDMFVPL